MSTIRLLVMTALAMIGFACNSLICRLALQDHTIDAGSFTAIRLVSGAIVLFLLASRGRITEMPQGSWLSAGALFAYAAGFSYAYITLSASTGALLLFGAVQATMIGYGLWKGERLKVFQILGFLMALIGLVGLLLPGVSAPPLFGASLMMCAGVAWGVYSIRGKGVSNPLEFTAGNFIRSIPFTLVLSIIMLAKFDVSFKGVIYAALSGAVASGIGYAIWYSVLPSLSALKAATVQLSVPVLTAIGGVLLLGEHVSLRLGLATIAILGGIALVIRKNK